MYVYRKNERRPHNHYCRGKAISIVYCECMFLALGILHEMRMHRFILTSVACRSPPYFSTLSHKRQIFRKKLSNIHCVSIFYKSLSDKFLIPRRIQLDTIINVLWSSYK